MSEKNFFPKTTVNIENESLTAVRLETSKILLLYKQKYEKNGKCHLSTQYEYYRFGSFSRSIANGSNLFLIGENSFVEGYQEAYKRLGPELLKKIPPVWKKILGEKWPNNEPTERGLESFEVLTPSCI